VRRRPLTLLVLGGSVALLAAGAGIVAWHPWSRGAAAGASTSGAGTAQFVTILDVKADQLRSIALTSAAGTIELDNVEGSWKIVRPATLALKQAPLDDLLYSVTALSSERVIEELPRDLSIYGLDDPAVTVRVTLADGGVREVYLGDMTPAADSYYLMAKGDPRVFTVREHHGAYFHYALQDLWEGARTPLDAADIVHARILFAGKLLVEVAKTENLARSDVEFRGTSLSVVYPWKARPKPVDSGFLTRFAQGFGSLRGEVAVDANPPDLARYGLDKPTAELLLRDGTGNALHAWTGKVEAGALYLRFEGDPTIYAGDPDLLALLAVEPFDFANKLALIVRLDRVDRLAISASGVRHVLEIRRPTPGSEAGAAWMVDGRPVDVKVFKDFYTNAVSLQADAFHDEPVSGKAEVSFEFGLNAGTVRTWTVGFVPHGQEFYAVVKNGASDMLVNRQQVKVLLQRLEELAGQAAAQ
jgi:hypothetical protein